MMQTRTHRSDHLFWLLGIFLVAGLVISTARPAQAQPTSRKERTAKAKKQFDNLKKAYLASEWDQAKKTASALRREYRFLEPEQRRTYQKLHKNIGDFTPRWWKAVTSPSSRSFPAAIWGRRFQAHYRPSRNLGMQSVQTKRELVRTRDGYEARITDLKVIVTWKPSLVNNPRPADGKLAEQMGYKLADLGQVIVWHELGHNFLTGSLSTKQNVQLYTKHQLLFGHLQEFFADLTALYHANPSARRAALQIRLEGLDYYNEEEPHTRAAHGIGALVIADILQHPKKWPSVHLPPKVPEKQVELNTIIYVYEHWDKDWSIDEALGLRKLIHDFVRQRGDRTFHSKGVFPLPYGTKFSLMAAQDRRYQPKRNRWVKKKLQAAIKSGRADELEEGQTYDPRYREKLGREQMIIIHAEDDEEDGPPRIEIPW